MYKYDGDFIDNNKEGWWTIYLSNGDHFTGEFYNDLVDGNGNYYKASPN